MRKERDRACSHWRFSTPLRVIPIGHSLTPWKFHPYGTYVSPGGLRWLQNLRFGHYCSAKAQNSNRHYVQIGP
jgi:hypothetical protein